MSRVHGARDVVVVEQLTIGSTKQIPLAQSPDDIANIDYVACDFKIMFLEGGSQPIVISPFCLSITFLTSVGWTGITALLKGVHDVQWRLPRWFCTCSRNVAYRDEFNMNENNAYDNMSKVKSHRDSIEMSDNRAYCDCLAINGDKGYKENFDMSGNSAYSTSYSTTLSHYEQSHTFQ